MWWDCEKDGGEGGREGLHGGIGQQHDCGARGMHTYIHKEGTNVSKSWGNEYVFQIARCEVYARGRSCDAQRISSSGSSIFGQGRQARAQKQPALRHLHPPAVLLFTHTPRHVNALSSKVPVLNRDAETLTSDVFVL